MTVRQLSLGGIPAVSLSNDLLELVVAPTLGMKITNLRRRRGREWLWRNPAIPYAPGVPGSSYVETADSGGWDECFPTVLPSRIPGAPPETPPASRSRRALVRPLGIPHLRARRGDRDLRHSPRHRAAL